MEQPMPDGQRYIGKFILYSALDEPDVDIDSYTLSIFGQTGKRLSYTYKELMFIKIIYYGS